MAIVDLTALPDGPKLVDYVVSEINKASAFMQVSKQLPLSYSGSVIPKTTQGYAAWIAEGASKPVRQPEFDTLTMTGKKLAKIVYVTNEFAQDKAVVWDTIKRDAFGTLAKTFDATVAGLVTAPTGFTTLAGSPVAVVTGRASFIAAIAPVQGKATTAIVLNEVLKYELLAISNSLEGGVLTITDTTINGIPYVILPLETTEPLGFVGPFRTDAFFGVIPGSVRVSMSNEATIVDEGVTVSLWQENKTAFLVEGYYGFRTSDDFENASGSLFREITTAVS